MAKKKRRKYTFEDAKEWAKIYKQYYSFNKTSSAAKVNLSTVIKWLTEYKDELELQFPQDLKKDGLKFCGKCCIVKSETEFYNDKSRNRGIGSWCKDCVKHCSKIERKKQKIINNRKDPYNEVGKKKCPGCKKMMESKMFSKSNFTPDGLYNKCKECVAKYNKRYREANKAKNSGTDPYAKINEKRCCRCKKTLPSTEFTICISTPDGLSDRCKICEKECREENKEHKKEWSKEYVRKNKEHITAKRKEYRKENKEHMLKQNNEYRRRRRKNDPAYRVCENLRKTLGRIIKTGSKSGILKKYLGCSAEELKQHIENQFQEGMTWENYGYYGWHIDHIIPLATIKDENDIRQIKRVCHYTNLQPLWAEENRSKSDKLDWEKGDGRRAKE